MQFFKDRHYLQKDWSRYFSDDNPQSNHQKVVLEVLGHDLFFFLHLLLCVLYFDFLFLICLLLFSLWQIGCGAGNTIFPLVSAFPNLFIHACDFSPHAIEIVKVSDRFPLFCFLVRIFLVREDGATVAGIHKCRRMKVSERIA